MGFPKREEFPDPQEQTRDTSARFHGDQRLRRMGFRIHARPDDGPALWERRGDVYTELQAHALCDREGCWSCNRGTRPRMPRVDIHLSVPVKRSPRLKQVEGMFDLAPAKTSEFHLQADVPLDAQPWQIGLIVGPSGCGKTTLARELFGTPPADAGGSPWPSDASIIDAFPRTLPIQEICGLLSSVGFSSPPAWCRPFHCLSNGEQFRVSVARALAGALLPEVTTKGNNSPLTTHPVVIDEFTSVVDRTVAQIGSAAIAKAIRARPGLRFVAVSCHYDVIDWLQPDWLFEPASGTFTRRSLQRRPALALEVVRAGRAAWALFRRHHYLSHELGAAARSFVGLVAGRPAVFTAVTSFPHPRRSGWREHRTVCLPDFQGVGLGNAMSELIAGIYHATGKPYRSITSHPAMIRHRARSPLWKMVRKPGVMPSASGSRSIQSFATKQTAAQAKAKFLRSASVSRLTASFEYVGPARVEEARKLGVI